MGYESFGLVFADSGFDLLSLESLFHRMTDAQSGYGEIVRAKGIFRTETAWKVLELASGDVSIQPIRPFNQSKVSVIGKSLNREMIEKAFQQCRSNGQAAVKAVINDPYSLSVRQGSEQECRLNK